MIILQKSNIDFTVKNKIYKKSYPFITPHLPKTYDYLFDWSLHLTNGFKEDGLCKRVNNQWQIINIYLAKMLTETYTSTDLAIKYFKNISCIDDNINPVYTVDVVDTIKRKLYQQYFIWGVLDINSILLLKCFYEKVYIDFSEIDWSFHVFVYKYKSDLINEYKINDYLEDADQLSFNFVKNDSVLYKLKSFENTLFENLKENRSLENQLLNLKKLDQKKFSIFVSKLLKRGIIKAHDIIKKLGLSPSEQYLHFNKNNCMVYQLSRFFTYTNQNQSINQNRGLLITEEGLYSVSKPKEADLITKYIKKHLLKNPNEYNIVDMTANVGGNVLNFARYFKHVYAIELQWLNYLVLKNNVNALGFDNKCTLIHGDSLNYLNNNYDIIFFDPPWGGVNYKSKTNVDLYLGDQSIVEIIYKLLKYGNCSLIVVKVPFNFNFSKLHHWGITFKCHKINNISLLII